MLTLATVESKIFKMSLKSLLSAAALSGLLSTPALADVVLASDNFNSYANGAIAGANGGTGWAGGWTGTSAASMNGGALQISGNGDNLATRLLSAPVTGNVIVRFDFTLSAGSLQDNDFLALWFGSPTGSAAGPNIGLKANCGAGCSNDLFVRTNGSDAGGNLQNVAAGTTYSLMGYLQKTASSSVYNRFDFWVNPSAEEIATLTGSDAFDTGNASIGSFSRIGFRGANLDNGDVIRIDNLRISQVPEPGVLALLSLSLAGLAVVSRRRQR